MAFQRRERSDLRHLEDVQIFSITTLQLRSSFVSDKGLLESLDHKLQTIRDRVTGVAEGWHNGFFLWGEGGTSKSFTVEETLSGLGKAFKLTNSRLTGRGLFDLLRDFPDAVHILEDIETLFADKNSFGVLRSALWGQAGDDGLQERVVVWQTARQREEFIFTGGLVMIANCSMDNLPQLRALKTRIACLQYQPTNQEVAALMRQVASKGHRHGIHTMSAEECREVADEIIERSTKLGRNLDLRLLVNGLQDRLQWSNGSSGTHWKDMIDSRMKGRAGPPTGEYENRAERKERELTLVRRIAHLSPQERLEVWKLETGKSQQAMYRRLAELPKDGSHISHFSQN
jgi:hypothetical protein